MTDRPWGVTLGAIALRRYTGQLTIESDGKRYCVAFDDGAIVAATSPLAADAIARVALTNQLITSTLVPDIVRRLAQAPDRDEVDVLADAVRFSPEQATKLRHRLVAQRAARTFSVEHGEFVLDERITVPVFAGVVADHRHVIYLGVRTNLSEQRLLDDLRQLGTHFVLKTEAIDELSRYGFEPSAQPVLEALKHGTSLPELEASHRELDPRFAQAIIYALVSCAACVIQSRTVTTPPIRNVTPRTSVRASSAVGTQPPPTAATPPPVGRSATKTSSGARTTSPFASRTATASPTAYSAALPPDTGTNTPAATRARTPSSPGAPRTTTAIGQATRASVAGIAPPVAAPGAPPSQPPASRVTTRPGPAPAPSDPPAARTSTDEAVRFVDLPTPSPLPASAKTAATFSDPRPKSTTAQRPSMARVATPSDAEALRGFADQRTPSGFGGSGFSDQRTPGFGDQRTPSDQRTPGPTPSRVSTDNAVAADEAFRRGELAMKRDQPGEAILEFKTACDLNPLEVDYAGMLAWAKFCAAGDKPAIGAETRKILERTVFKSNRPERARFYLGRVERMLGRDKEALRHFHEVLDLKPNHAEAASEVRAIEARLQAASKGSTGLFGRKR